MVVTPLKVTTIFKGLDNGGISILVNMEGGLGGLAVTYTNLEFADETPLLAFYEFLHAIQVIFWQQVSEMARLRDESDDELLYDLNMSQLDGINIEAPERE